MAAQNEIRALTGIRGIAACFVVLYHYLQMPATSGTIAVVINHGYLAVDLFFVLSGFVMMMSYEPSFRSSFNISKYTNFLYKRLGRTYPLYAVITLLFTVAIYSHVLPDQAPDTSELIWNMVLLHGWGLATSLAGPTWSISTEFAAYFLFPALVYYTARNNRYVWVMLLLASVAVLISIASLSAQQVHQVYDGIPSRNGPLDVFETTTFCPLLRCLAGFTFGVVAFRLSELAWVIHLRQQPFACDFIMVAALIGLALPSSDVAEVILFMLLVSFLAEGKSITGAILASAPIYWLGIISYSIYLIHVFLNSLFRGRLSDFLDRMHVPHAYSVSALLLLPVVIVVSAATYHLIERPARDGLRQLRNRRVISTIIEASVP